MEAKRRALDEIAVRQRAADQKRQQELERLQQAAVVSPSVVVQLSGMSNLRLEALPLQFFKL
jgi:hypothetical protein